MKDLKTLWNAILEAYGEETVYNLAENYELYTVYFDDIPEENAHEVFAEMVCFVLEELSEISIEKAQRVLERARISDDVIKDLLGF